MKHITKELPRSWTLHMEKNHRLFEHKLEKRTEYLVVDYNHDVLVAFTIFDSGLNINHDALQIPIVVSEKEQTITIGMKETVEEGEKTLEPKTNPKPIEKIKIEFGCSFHIFANMYQHLEESIVNMIADWKQSEPFTLDISLSPTLSENSFRILINDAFSIERTIENGNEEYVSIVKNWLSFCISEYKKQSY